VRRLIPHARRVFRLTLPAIVFMWVALPAHACAHEPWNVASAAHSATADVATPGSMPVDCGHCPAHAGQHSPLASPHCVKPGPGTSDSRPLKLDLPVTLAVLFLVVPVGIPRRSVDLQRLARPRFPRRPLHLEKRVLLI
jgi:hypothetical protein